MSQQIPMGGWLWCLIVRKFGLPNPLLPLWTFWILARNIIGPYSIYSPEENNFIPFWKFFPPTLFFFNLLNKILLHFLFFTEQISKKSPPKYTFIQPYTYVYSSTYDSISKCLARHMQFFETIFTNRKWIKVYWSKTKKFFMRRFNKIHARCHHCNALDCLTSLEFKRIFEYFYKIVKNGKNTRIIMIWTSSTQFSCKILKSFQI